jgi:hypothetical protein
MNWNCDFPCWYLVFTSSTCHYTLACILNYVNLPEIRNLLLNRLLNAIIQRSLMQPLLKLQYGNVNWLFFKISEHALFLSRSVLRPIDFKKQQKSVDMTLSAHTLCHVWLPCRHDWWSHHSPVLLDMQWPQLWLLGWGVYINTVKVFFVVWLHGATANWVNNTVCNPKLNRSLTNFIINISFHQPLHNLIWIMYTVWIWKLIPENSECPKSGFEHAKITWLGVQNRFRAQN